MNRPTPQPDPALAEAEDLARGAHEGSSACFARLVVLYQGRLYNFLLRRAATPADAEDLVQETFVRAWRQISRYKPGMRFSTWLFTIGSRLASNARRDRARAPSALDHDPVSHADPSARSQAREEHRRIWALADEVLTPDQRGALWLRYSEGLETAEIARILGKTTIGVRVLLFRARDRLADALPDAPRHAEPSRRDPGAVGCPVHVGGGL